MAEGVKLARLEAQVEAVKSTVDRVVGHLEHSAQERTQQYTEIVKNIAVLQNVVQTYQDICTIDRKEIAEAVKVSDDRIQVLENFKSIIRGQAAGVSIVSSIIVGTGTLILGWFGLHK